VSGGKAADAPAEIPPLEPATAAPPEPPAAAAAETRKILDVCEGEQALVLASSSLAERQHALEVAAAQLQIQLGPGVAEVEALTADYLRTLSQRIASDSSLQTGAGVDLLVTELLSRICAEPGVASWIPAVCEPSPGSPALIELRRRLLADLVTLPRRVAEREGSLTAASAEMRSTLALLAAAFSANATWQVVQELAPQAGSCNAAQLSSAPAPDVPARAAQLVQRLLADGAKLERSDEYYERVLQKELQRLRGESSLTPALSAAAKEVLAAVKAIERAGAPKDAAALEARSNELVRLLQAALRAVAVDPTPITVPAAGIELTRAALRGELDVLANRALSLAAQIRGMAIPDHQTRAIDTVVRFALARDEAEAKRILRGLIVPLPRWSESILFDLNGDIPSLERGDFRLVGDALLGYNGKNWGVTGQGSLAEYDFSTELQIAETTAVDGGLESWLSISLGETRRTKLELRLFGKAALYDTSHTTAAGAAGLVGDELSDETSVMGRGGLLVSLRYQPGERFASGLWLGAGAQYEWYDTADFADRTFDSQTTQSLGLLLNARARVEVAIVPRWLVSRLRVDAQRYSLTRSSISESFGSTNSSSARQLSAQQLELKTRLFLDAEVARFGGFVPSVNAGFDSAFFDSDVESYRSFVPVVGAGIRREAF
jgi:hypothetical protein